MTAEQRLAAAHALWRDDDAKDDQAQAAGLIAQQLKFRLKTVNGLDKDRKARYLAVPSLHERSPPRARPVSPRRAAADDGRVLEALAITHETA